MTDEEAAEGRALQELFSQLMALRETGATKAEADDLLAAIEAAVTVDEAETAAAVAAGVDLEVAEILFRNDGDRARAGPVARRAADRFAAVARAPEWLGDPVALRLNALRFSVLSRATVEELERDLDVVRAVPTGTPQQVLRQVQALRAADNLLWALGDMQRFQRLADEVAHLSERGDAQCEAMGLRMKSKSLRRAGRYVEARAAAEQALATAPATATVSRANCLLEVAFVTKGLGEVAEAMHAIDEAIKLFRAAGAKRGLRTSLDVAASLEIDDDAALGRLDEALSLVGTDGVGGATLFLHRARLVGRPPVDRMLDLNEAFLRALATYGSGRVAAEVSVEVARLVRTTTAEAPGDLRERLERAVEWASTSLHPGLAGDAMIELARLFWARGDRDGVVELVLRATQLLDQERRLLTTDDDRFRVAERHHDGLLFALEVLADIGTAIDAAVVIEQLRARAVALATSTGLDALPEEARLLVAQIAAAQEAQSSMATGGADDAGEADETASDGTEGGGVRRRRAFSDLVDSAWAEASKVLSAAVLTAMSPPTVDRHSLDGTCAALDGVWLSWEVVAERNDGLNAVCTWRAPDGEWSVERVRVQGEAWDLLVDLMSPGTPAYERALLRTWPVARAQLGATLIPPAVRRLLLDSGAPVPLVICPSAHLWSVPWPALRISGGEGEERDVVDLADVYLAPSAGILDSVLARPRLPWSEVGTFYADLSLPGAKAEAMALERLGATRAPDAVSWRSALRYGATQHIAVASAHGVPGVGLAQGLDFDGVPVTAGSLIDTTLPPVVVFAACRSGEYRSGGGGGGEPLALVTVALGRGARQVVGSIYDVSDLAARDILPDFYDHFMEGRVPAGRALWAAVRSFRERAPGDRALRSWPALAVFGVPD